MEERKLTKAQEATQAIERIYITMRHLFNRGFYKPMGISGSTLRKGLLALKPEIYGSIAEDKLELDGLSYVLDRLPVGIEECKTINLTGEEGYHLSHLKPIIPPKRRRHCYRIDKDQMNVEITRGRSDIYDILTHLTFLFIESHKIAERVVLRKKGTLTDEWLKFERIVLQEEIEKKELEAALFYASNIVGRTFQEILSFHEKIATKKMPYRFLRVIYWLGKLAVNEILNDDKRIILFSSILQERTGHHIHGERWATRIKKELDEQGLLERPIHIVSSNMHSVKNFLFGKQFVDAKKINLNKLEVFERLSKAKNEKDREYISNLAKKRGMIELNDNSGTNIDVQLFDLSKIKLQNSYLSDYSKKNNAVIIVMDYAFGEQAFETMDELLKPYDKSEKKRIKLNIQSVSIMGKAGILSGNKGDIMIPNAHIFEGTTDNYPFKNELKAKDFTHEGVHVAEGPMITVLGTSLQNKEMLKYFMKSTWEVMGLEMEGAHYQKAIQAASKIRNSVSSNLKVRYAYYASDNPLKTGSTLASGGLGLTGVKPTYLITEKIIKQIVEQKS